MRTCAILGWALMAGAWLSATAGCGEAGADEREKASVTVFAAASTTDALEQIARRFEAARGLEVRLNFASSSTLARQIRQGAGADVFISANPRWMDHLERQGLIRAGTRRDLLGNRLALIAAPQADLRIEPRRGFDLAGSFVGRLAMGDPQHVPAGMYAAQALRSMGWWDALTDRIAPAADVRRALRFVETGETSLGIVYATDAAAGGRVKIVGLLPVDSHRPIRYPAAAIVDSPGQAEAFLAYLSGPEATEIFRRHGFEVFRARP
jgi:molybdate transport system substrate-binding protein